MTAAYEAGVNFFDNAEGCAQGQAETMIALQPPQYRLVTVHEGMLTSRVYEVAL